MNSSEKINEITQALSVLQSTIKPAQKDGKNPFFKSSYSTLFSVWESIRELIQECNIAIVQDAQTSDKGVSVSTRILHSSGQWLEFGPLCIQVKLDAHSIGSATTYAKRYSLCAALGIVSIEEDDDGNSAHYQDKKPEEPKLTHQQIMILKSLCVDPSWEQGLLGHLELKRLDEINQSRFEACKGMLMTKAKQVEKNG